MNSYSKDNDPKATRLHIRAFIKVLIAGMAGAIILVLMGLITYYSRTGNW